MVAPDGSQIAYHRNTQTPTGMNKEVPRRSASRSSTWTERALSGLPEPRPREAEAGRPRLVARRIAHPVLDDAEPRRGKGQTGSPGIFTIRPDGTGLTDVCGTCLQGGIAPSWTPDGRHILFWGFRTWALMDPDGANMTHINSPDLTFFGEELGYGYFALLSTNPLTAPTRRRRT